MNTAYQIIHLPEGISVGGEPILDDGTTTKEAEQAVNSGVFAHVQGLGDDISGVTMSVTRDVESIDITATTGDDPEEHDAVLKLFTYTLIGGGYTVVIDSEGYVTVEMAASGGGDSGDEGGWNLITEGLHPGIGVTRLASYSDWALNVNVSEALDFGYSTINNPYDISMLPNKFDVRITLDGPDVYEKIEFKNFDKTDYQNKKRSVWLGLMSNNAVLPAGNLWGAATIDLMVRSFRNMLVFTGDAKCAYWPNRDVTDNVVALTLSEFNYKIEWRAA